MSPTEYAVRKVSAGARLFPKYQKLRCYLVCLLALLLTLSPKFICQAGLCILLVFSGLAAARSLQSAQTPAGRKHLLWLLLALGWAAGVLASGGDFLVCALCFFASLLCWGVYLGRCAYAHQDKTLVEIFAIVFQATFYDPWAFFDPPPSYTPDKRKRWMARIAYVAYILATVLVLLILLLIQAESRMDRVLRFAFGFVQEKAPLILSCLVLALFPAMLVYSFLSKLNKVSLSVPLHCPSVRKESFLKTLPWSILCIVLTAFNWLFLLVVLYYYVILNEPVALRADGLYDVLAVFILIFIGLIVTCYWSTRPRRTSSKASVALGISLFGLILFASFRLFTYVMYYGLWSERALFSVILLAFTLPLLCLTFFSGQTFRRFFHCLVSLLSIFLITLIIIPRGVILTQANAAIFLYKYHTHSLDGQSDVDAELPLELASHDLRLDLMKDYGVNGIPALLCLVNIDDVTVDGEPLGHCVQDLVLDCLCIDLGLSRTGDNQRDFNAVCSTADQIPRYRIPTIYAWAFQQLKELDQIFGP